MLATRCECILTSLSAPKSLYAPHLCGPLLVVWDCLRLRHTACKRTRADGLCKVAGTCRYRHTQLGLQ